MRFLNRINALVLSGIAMTAAAIAAIPTASEAAAVCVCVGRVCVCVILD